MESLASLPFFSITNSELNFLFIKELKPLLSPLTNSDSFVVTDMLSNQEDTQSLPSLNNGDSNSSCSYSTLDEIENWSCFENSFALLHINCRSLKKNFDKVQQFLLSLNNMPSVITVSETWLNDNSLAHLFSLPNYQFISKPRLNGKRGGGVGIYILNTFNYSEKSYSKADLLQVCEFCTVEVQIPNGDNIIIASFYRPPDSDLASFNAAFTNFIESFKIK
jgi:hypothetical protein